MGSEPSIPVLLVDDHPVVLEGIRALLQPPFACRSIAESGEHALELLEQDDFAVLIADYAMRGISCSDLIHGALVRRPGLRIIILTMHDDPALIREVLQAGAQAFILKQDSPDAVMAALHAVMEGKTWMSPGAEKSLSIAAHVEEVLTERERQIVLLIAQEFNSRQIAEKLFISENTVEAHRRNIFRKTGVTNLVGLVRLAYDRGWIPRSAINQ